MGKAKKATKTPYLDNLAKKSRIERQKLAIHRFYVVVSTLIIVIALIMIAINPANYLNMITVLLLTSILLLSIENIQLHRLKKPQNL